MAEAFKRVRRYLSMAPEERRLFVEAYLELVRARMALFMVPSRIVTRRMGVQDCETSSELGAEDQRRARAIGRAIARASRYTPWLTVCLPQAMAARAMLRRRGVPTTVYLGVARASALQITAHAWTRCGEVIVTGEREAGLHTQMASFADPATADRR